MGLRRLIFINLSAKSPIPPDQEQSRLGTTLSIRWSGRIAAFIRSRPFPWLRRQQEAELRAEISALQARIGELEVVLAEYALQFGLSDRARGAFRADGGREMMVKGAHFCVKSKAGI
jgi:hypothetical protein